jgi:molybdopterin converting factor small subunit
MEVKIIAYGIAKDITGSRRSILNVPDAITVGDFRSVLYREFPELKELTSLAIAIDDEYRDDKFLIHENVEVILIPPVSGG